MPRSFTEQEKQNIHSKLITECEKSWAKFGYKKTNIDELCVKSGISKGAFYGFFESKEALFCETLRLVQDRLYSYANDIMEREPNKYGLAKVLKTIYREYDKCSFICNTHSMDFISFTNKLNPQQLNQIEEYSEKSSMLFFEKPYLKFAVEKDKGIAALYVALSSISVKEELLYNHLEVFDFMVDSLIDKIFI
ncbi:MAG: TetR/AcrR family transcriptional regulator [Anaerovoracaceae bacterium]